MGVNLEKGQRTDIGLKKSVRRSGIQISQGAANSIWMHLLLCWEPPKNLYRTSIFFYNNDTSPDGALKTTGDDRTGGSSDGDDESITVDIPKINPAVQEIIFTVTIHDFAARKQTFGQVRNSFYVFMMHYLMKKYASMN